MEEGRTRRGREAAMLVLRFKCYGLWRPVGGAGVELARGARF